MKIIACVQARISSHRLPGKVLVPIKGRPMIDYCLTAVSRADGIDNVVLTTSEDVSDDVLCSYARNNGHAFFRGRLTNVADRLLACADTYEADAIVRISGDSPLLLSDLLTRAVSVFRAGRLDLVTNVYTRTFPKGLSVEVLRVEALRQELHAGTTDDVKEHVTSFFYQKNKSFNIHSIEHAEPLGACQLSVDTQEDFDIVSSMIGLMTKPAWQHSVGELLDLRERAIRHGVS